MKRAALFLSAALALFIGPYLVTEREVFFPRPSDRPGPSPGELRAAEELVRQFLARLPDAYAKGSSAPVAFASARPEALAPLESDLAFLAAQGRAVALELRTAEVRAEVEPDGKVRVRSHETWSVREGAARREAETHVVYLVEETAAGPRIAGWEVFP